MPNQAVLSGNTQARIRVIVTDGVNTGLDASDPAFSVERKRPEVYLLGPDDVALFAPGAPVIPEGLAMDVEDGPLADAALLWTSDRHGFIGTDRFITRTDLLPGFHTLTLTPIDNNGMAGTAIMKIFVGYPLYLPGTPAIGGLATARDSYLR